MLIPLNAFLSRTLLCLFSLLVCSFTHSQEPEIEKGFLIIQSTKDYKAALQTVNEASEKLDLKIDLRDYYACPENGLKTDLVCECGKNHGYIARGRYDDGVYISIEYSNNYRGFTEGYYIVILASGEKNDANLLATFEKAKKIYSDAYVKQTIVHIGCMH